MNQQSTAANSANGASTPHDLFVLTDEQILEIEPEGEVNLAPGFGPPASSRHVQSSAAPAVILSEPAKADEARDPGNTFRSPSSQSARQDSSVASLPRNDRSSPESPEAPSTEHGSRDTGRVAQPGVAVLTEPPRWLAAQMKDPWSGEEAREFWNGVQQARSEAAAYRAAFATPEDARALKELYPGGVNEAREATTRARLLDEIDRAYFGVPGGSEEQTSATRADLAQRMLREDPAAFREMVFAGLRALEVTERGSTGVASTSNLPRLAQVFSENRVGVDVAPPFRAASSAAPPVAQAFGPEDVSSPGETATATAKSLTPEGVSYSHDNAHAAAYAAFEKAANEDLERSVGGAIARTIEQALPNLNRGNAGAVEGARHGVPLQDRLSAAVRQDVEAALKGDRQLGEQIAQILSGRRFDNETRAQVVRLIDDRARQLVPSAARRVINEWTQTTLAAHRGNAARAGAASTRREVEPVAAQGSVSQRLPADQAGPGASSRAAQTRPGADPHRNALHSDARRLDYRKLTDEQILEM